MEVCRDERVDMEACIVVFLNGDESSNRQMYLLCKCVSLNWTEVEVQVFSYMLGKRQCMRWPFNTSGKYAFSLFHLN